MKGRYQNIKIVFLPRIKLHIRASVTRSGHHTSFQGEYVKLMMTYVVNKIDEVDKAAEVCRSINVLRVIRWIAQVWEAAKSSTIVKCFAKAGVLGATGDVVEGQASPNDDQDQFADLDKDLSLTDSLLQESCGPATV